MNMANVGNNPMLMEHARETAYFIHLTKKY